MALVFLKCCLRRVILIYLILQLLSMSMTQGESTITARSDATVADMQQSQVLYILNLVDPNGVYRRRESVTLEDIPGNGKHVHVSGTFYLRFPNSRFKFQINYTADDQGFHASYKFGTKISINSLHRLGVNTLKTLAG